MYADLHRTQVIRSGIEEGVWGHVLPNFYVLVTDNFNDSVIYLRLPLGVEEIRFKILIEISPSKKFIRINISSTKVLTSQKHGSESWLHHTTKICDNDNVDRILWSIYELIDQYSTDSVISGHRSISKIYGTEPLQKENTDLYTPVHVPCRYAILSNKWIEGP